MHMRSQMNRANPFGAIRFSALAASVFVAIAASHETLLALERAATQSHCVPAQKPSAPAPAHHQDHTCALCELAGSPTLITLAVAVPQLQADVQAINVASHLTSAVRDTSCFPHLRRAPPSFPLV